MNKRVLTVLLGSLLMAGDALAQQKTVTGKVTGESGAPVAAVQVLVKGTSLRTSTNDQGNYMIQAAPGQVLQFRSLGTSPVERVVGAENTINVELRRVATNLDAVTVVALGQTQSQRSIGTAQQLVAGEEVAQTQRLNFINSLQGRVAGVEVTSTSGLPGAGTSITIRGISSISSSNQPLMIIDGLPLDNKTLHTAGFASGRGGSPNSFENRGIDFTNRAADLNPDDIESLVVLKGPEASALYGIDAANGAIVITTKRGRAGVHGLQYNTSFMAQQTRGYPKLQQVYDTSGAGSSSMLFWGDPYPAGTQFYDNVAGFFRTALQQQHNLSFDGGSSDQRMTYRLSGSGANQEGFIPNTQYKKFNLSGATTAQVNNWLNADLSMIYAFTDNRQTFQGAGSPLLGLLVWPQTDNAKDWLSPAGTRRRISNISAGAEYDNPYFMVNRNRVDSKNNRLISNLGLTVTPFSWGYFKTNIGVDQYTNQNLALRHPESQRGFQWNGVLDIADDVTRNISAQTLFNFNSYAINDDWAISGLVGNSVNDQKSVIDAMTGQDFLDPNFVSINNTNLRYSQSTTTQRRLLSAFGQATVDFRRYLYLTVTGRNDWTSTIPQERNSFFYPSVSTSFIFSDAFPSVSNIMTGKLRAAYAEVGRDAKPYSYLPALEYKVTSYGGYGFGFWGPNRKLKPEFKKSWEFGTDLSFLNDRLGVEATYYSARTYDQIVQNIRGSYGTGFVLFNLNGAQTKNAGLELVLRGLPVVRGDFSWDVVANFDRSAGKTLALPNELPESYNSDTWLYGNVRNGTFPGTSTRSLSGQFYLRNDAGKILIDPSTGLPLRSAAFIDRGYDRQPQWTLGLTNSVKFKDFSVSALLDFRRGGDILNATQHYLTARGLTPETLDRWDPRVIDGVLRDGKENSANPTPNNIVIVPALNTSYYTAMSEELFIEQDINWLRLRDITVNYQLPARILSNASVFVTATDLFLLTNYSGLDPLGSATSVASGGSGSAGIDYGGFPVPRGIAFGTKVRF